MCTHAFNETALTVYNALCYFLLNPERFGHKPRNRLHDSLMGQDPQFEKQLV